MGIDDANSIQRPNDTGQFRIDQGQRNLLNIHPLTQLMMSGKNHKHWSKVVAILRVEGSISL